MCRPATCKTCGKTTWAGCGQHVGQVRAAVPAGQWCPGTPVANVAAVGWVVFSAAEHALSELSAWPSLREGTTRAFLISRRRLRWER